MKSKAHDVIKNCLLLICLGLFIWVPSVSAIGNIRLGRFEVHPEISYKGEWNDNVFWEHENEEDDFIHTITPGIRIETTGEPGNFFSTGYTVGIARYDDFDDNDYENHQAYLSAGVKTPRGLYLTAEDRYQNTEDPYGSESEFGLGRQTERWNNRAEIVAGYEFAETYGIEGTYRNFVERYDLKADEFQDQTHHIYGVAFLYRVTGKTSLFGQFLRKDVEYDSQNDGIDENNDGFDEWNSSNSQDYGSNAFFIGARFDPQGKLSGEVKLGFATIDFDNDADLNGNQYNDDDFFAAAVDMDYQVREKTGLSLTIDVAKQPSTTADRAADVSATFEQARVRLELMQNFTERFSMDFGLGWRYRDYLDEAPGVPSKYFNLYEIKAGAGYLIRDWIKVGLEYKYEDNQAGNSRYEGDEYTVNMVALEVKATF